MNAFTDYCLDLVRKVVSRTDFWIDLLTIAVCLYFLLPVSAKAEPWFVEAAGGYTTFKQYKVDGARFYQEPFPWSSDMKSPSGRIGIGQKINDRWDYTVSWLVIGNNSVNALIVWDADYDPSTHKCISNCDTLHQIRAYGDGRGPELAFRRNFESVYLRGGVFLWLTQLHVQVWPEGDKNQEYRWHAAQHWMLTPFIGAGVKHRLGYFELFGEVAYYRAVETNGGYPLSKEAIVPMLGVRATF